MSCFHIEAAAIIDKLELDVRLLNDEISKAGQQGNVERVTELGGQYTAASDQLESLFAQWEEISLALEEAGAE